MNAAAVTPLPPVRRAGWILAAVVGGVVSAGAVVVFVFDPSRTSFFPPCVFHEVTGWYCPGCGSTRALHALMHGQFGAAVQWNPLTTLVLPAVALAAWWRKPSRWRPWVVWLLVAAVVVFGVVRNLPAKPWSWLAPQTETINNGGKS